MSRFEQAKGMTDRFRFFLSGRRSGKIDSNEYFWRVILLTHLLLAGVLFVVFARFDPDPQHDGTQLGSAIGVAEGLTVHREVFSQYGPIGPWLNGLLMAAFGHKLLVLRLITAVQLVAVHLLIYKVARLLGTKRSIAHAACFTWLICCPVWAYQKWFFQLWPWPSVTYMLLALCGTYLILKSRSQVSDRTVQHIVAGFVIGIAIMSRPNYGVPFAFVLLIFLVVEFRLQPDFRIPWHLITGFIIGLGGVLVLLGFTDSLGHWLSQSIAGPAKSFLPEFLGWRYIYELYVRDQLILAILIALLVLVSRVKVLAISILTGIAVVVVSTKYFYVSIVDPVLTVVFGRETEFLERVPDQLSTTVILRSTLIGSVLVVSAYMISLFRRSTSVRRRGFNRLFEIAPLVACGVGALAQLYPYPDLYHFWWASPPFVILCAVGLSRIEFRSIRLGILLCVLIPTSVNVAKIREQVSIPRIEWSGGVLDGMLVDRDFYPSFEQAALFLRQVKAPVDFDCREGLWAVFSSDYLAAGPDYVNWAYGSTAVTPNGLIDTVRCADPETAETLTLAPVSSATTQDDATPLSFSRWSGWFDFYMLKSTGK